jgi:hypothetical protein
MDSSTLVGLVQDSLIWLQEVGVHVVSLTLDDPSVHISMAQTLGASFDTSNPAAYLIDSSTSYKDYVNLDACHMLKLGMARINDFVAATQILPK